MSDTPSLRTPLYDLHLALGGKMVDFAGWTLPIQYKPGIMAEHKHCREKAALFDVSHMMQTEVRGAGAAKAFETLCPSAIEGLPEGKARYTFFTNEDGGVLDDLIVSNAGESLFVVTNAAMRDQDLPLMQAGLNGCEVKELTERALLALQGPSAEEVLKPLAPEAADLTFMQTTTAEIMGVPCRVSRLGYTGEDGFEISIPASDAEGIAKALLAHRDVEPAGLGARDSLRLEAGLCLYGSDLSPKTSPVEAQLTWAIQKRRREEGGFPGAERILREIAAGPARKLVGIKPDGRAPARAGVEVFLEDRKIGEVTSGGFGPTVGGPVALAYLEADSAEPGTAVMLSIRGKAHPAQVVKPPFAPQRYKR